MKPSLEKAELLASEGDLYADIYTYLHEILSPHVLVHPSENDLPIGIQDAVEFLLEFWLANRKTVTSTKE
jgi:hypothetical protein